MIWLQLLGVAALVALITWFWRPRKHSISEYDDKE